MSWKRFFIYLKPFCGTLFEQNHIYYSENCTSAKWNSMLKRVQTLVKGGNSTIHRSIRQIN